MTRTLTRASRAISLLTLGLATASFAGDDGPLDDRIYVAPLVNYTISDSERLVDDALGGTLLVGKPLNQRLNLELAGFLAEADPEDGGDSAELTGFGANLLFFPNRGSNPLFGMLSVSQGNYEMHPGTGGPFEYDSTLIDVGVGGLWPVWGQRAWLRGQAAYRYDAHSEQLAGEGQRDGFYEPVFALGLQIALGAAPAAPTRQPKPTKVVEPVEPAPVPAEPVEPVAPKPVLLRGVNFDLDSARLTANAKIILDTVAETLLDAPDAKFTIAGHTDNTASEAYNQALSERRAAAVARYLQEQGVAATRMDTRGFGETQPVASNDTAQGRARNRRVELELRD